jgi:hypothetical protein
VHICTIAKRHHWTDPEGEERTRTVTELQETAAPWPHLLAEHAGIFIGASQQASEIDAKPHLIAAQLLIEAGADLAEVERWIPEGVKRAEPKVMQPHMRRDT